MYCEVPLCETESSRSVSAKVPLKKFALGVFRRGGERNGIYRSAAWILRSKQIERRTGNHVGANPCVRAVE